MPVTLTTVARLAGVSTSTASRALSGHSSVLPDTRARVVAAASALRYHPNRMASALRTRRTGLVGLVVNNLWSSTFSTIAETVQMWGAQAGYQVLICSTRGDAVREAAFLDTAVQHSFDGVIIAGSGANHDRINTLLDEGTAVVTMTRDVPGSRAPSVRPAYGTAARLATEHLLALGHTRIATIGAVDKFTCGREQHAAVVASLAAAGLQLDEALVHRGRLDPEFGRIAAEAVLGAGSSPTALLITNHEASFGVLSVLSERGVDIPGQLSVVCTEDEPFFGWWCPALTAVDIRAAHMAAAAAGRLHEQLVDRDGPVQPDHQMVEPVLIVRASAGPPSP